MPELNGPKAEIRLTLDITRAATGLTEQVELVGYVDPSALPQPDEKEADE